MMLRVSTVLLLLAACTPPNTTKTDPPDASRVFHYERDDVLTPWHAQLKATHNSYHVQGDIDTLPWNYTHLPLSQQAYRQGVRGFELDLNYEPAQQRIAVYHVANFDPVSNCPTLPACLADLKIFSDDNPAHFPLFVQMEPKVGVDAANVAAFIAQVESDILSVFPRERIVTPDFVKGDSPTLAEALRTRGWPTLGKLRGKVMFGWDTRGEVRTAYTYNNTDLHDRLMFVDSAPADPFAGFSVHNEPAPSIAAIQAALAAGMLVRTRADTDGNEARDMDKTRGHIALASGATFISTDYPAPAVDGGYSFEIADGKPLRCNPVTTDGGVPCRAEDLEDPQFIHGP